MNAPLVAVELGRRRYGEILTLQRTLCRDRVAGKLVRDVLLLVEHDPVVTLGRSTQAASLPVPRALLEQRGIEVFEVERGGDVTLHAPGQLVGYPILDLSGWRRDLHWYLRQLEEVLIRALDRLGIPAERNAGKTGVWTSGAAGKIASIGIHVKQWVTMHGFALNVLTDLSLFELIVPCGIPDVVMTSVAAEGQAGSGTEGLWGSTHEAIIAAFGEVFEREVERAPTAALGETKPA
ncbi:MAG TPA: lipoyl(octanoyl) transferase LipB [Gemmatimonadales bacterium]|jgi:lipoate-protein ligase B|nr:lipoyl(octanoyl) transferase LipB [Gemmatimonadales bacterium]